MFIFTPATILCWSVANVCVICQKILDVLLSQPIYSPHVSCSALYDGFIFCKSAKDSLSSGHNICPLALL